MPTDDEEICSWNAMIDHITTYDCMCQFSVHLVEHIKKHFPDVAPVVKRMRCGIPALHVQGHREDCMYFFGTAYMESVGHFHGETTEHYWQEANQIWSQTQQMNHGHQQDMLIDHHNNWNWKKTVLLCKSIASSCMVSTLICSLLATTLTNDLTSATKLYTVKRDHFHQLSRTHAEKVRQWNSLDRQPHRVGQEVRSVYKHNKSKGQFAFLMSNPLTTMDVSSAFSS